uniref:Uncharacterized protein n=1 Tax=Piliocolobus tephrosceles TaxID=591936 RepID=A0A8C9J173_9PRIM
MPVILLLTYFRHHFCPFPLPEKNSVLIFLLPLLTFYNSIYSVLSCGPPKICPSLNPGTYECELIWEKSLTDEIKLKILPWIDQVDAKSNKKSCMLLIIILCSHYAMRRQ